MMKILIGKSAGFCGGVLNSVNRASTYLEQNKNVYCLGELVHNPQVIKDLENKGLKIINSLDEIDENSKVIIRAHGIPKETYDLAQKRKIELYDLTCPKVLKIHDDVKKYVNEDYFIVLIAHKTHPEVIGTISFCGENSIIVEDEEDIEKTVAKIRASQQKKVVVIAQTTFSMDLFDEMAEMLKKELHDYELVIDNTICNATEKRQKEIKELATKVDAMIIIGGKNSSNTKKLYDISKSICQNTYAIETVEDLNTNFNSYQTIGIMAGASTPQKSIDEVREFLEKYN